MGQGAFSNNDTIVHYHVSKFITFRFLQICLAPKPLCPNHLQRELRVLTAPSTLPRHPPPTTHVHNRHGRPGPSLVGRSIITKRIHGFQHQRKSPLPFPHAQFLFRSAHTSAGKFSKDEKSPDSLCHSTSAAISTTCACGPRRTSCRSTPRRISSPRLKRAISSTSTCLEEVLGRDRQIKNRVKSGLVGLLRG